MDINSTYGTSSQNESSDDIWLREVVYNIRMCFLPIVVAGTLSNILNFIVLSRKEMRCLSTSVYLLALAIADMGVMYLELFRVWFELMDFVDQELYFTEWYCKIVNYGNGIVRDFSNWLIACLAFERLMMVAAPHTAKAWCTVSRAKNITICLLLVISVPHMTWLKFSVPLRRTWWVCWEDPTSKLASYLAATVEITVGYTVIIVVFLLNVALTTMLVRMKLPCIRTPKHSKSALNRQRHNRRLTRTLILLALVFMVCETPRIMVSFICRFIQRTPTLRIILNVSYVISGVNHASNFFIYILASPRFRHIVFLKIGKSSCRLKCRKVISNSAQSAVLCQNNAEANITLLQIKLDKDEDIKPTCQ